jgi:putative alpha-1,2-mannosidase
LCWLSISDTTIIGFAHTNFSGTGHSDLGDLLVMPTVGKLILDPLKTSEETKGFFSTFSHDKEEASPGYYKVDLDSYSIKAELTASERVGFHQDIINGGEIIFEMSNVLKNK